MLPKGSNAKLIVVRGERKWGQKEKGLCGRINRRQICGNNHMELRGPQRGSCFPLITPHSLTLASVHRVVISHRSDLSLIFILLSGSAMLDINSFIKYPFILFINVSCLYGSFYHINAIYENKEGSHCIYSAKVMYFT